MEEKLHGRGGAQGWPRAHSADSQRKPEEELPSLKRSPAGFSLTKKGQKPIFELCEREDAPSRFAKPKRLVLHNWNLLLAGLPFDKDVNTGAGLD